MKNFKLQPCGINDATLYVTEYEQGALKGWISHPHLSEVQKVESAPHMLFLLKQALEHDITYKHAPFSLPQTADGKELLATIRLQLIGREHHTWQGAVVWEEHQVSAPFLSIFEMLQIIDEILNT